MPKGFATLLLVLAVMAGVPGCTRPVTPGAPGDVGSKLPPDVVARVAGQDVPRSALDLRLRIYEFYFHTPLNTAQNVAQVLEHIIETAVMTAEARKQGLKVEEAQLEAELGAFMAVLDDRYDGRPAAEKRMKELKLGPDDLRDFLSGVLLGQAAAEKITEAVALSEEDLSQFYAQNKNSLYTFTDDVVRARHILVRLDEEKKAHDLAARARSGEDFSRLARDFSTDPGSGRVGGDLGYFKKSDMVPEFAEAAFALQPGEVGGPVRSQFGWHIIKVDDRRPPGTVPYDLAKGDITNKLLPTRQQEALRKWLDDLKKAAGVQRADPARLVPAQPAR